MTVRWTSLLAVVLFAVSMFGLVCSLALPIAASSFADGLGNDRVFYPVAFASLAPIGLLLAIHRPSNPIGWIFLATAIAQMSFAAIEGYATYIAGETTGTPTDLLVLFWFTSWIMRVAFFPPFTFGLLLFPTGRLPSRRWRIFAWVGGSQLLLLALATIIRPGPLDLPLTWREEVSNPTGIDALKFPAEAAWIVAGVLVMTFALGSAVSLFVRLRGATVQERQQLKWLAYAAAIPVANFVIAAVEDLTSSTEVGWYIFLLGIAAPPIAIGIAILRHNLYDIDRLINRTLVYGLLTGLLLLSFAASVIFFNLILSPLTSGNDLAVAGSTLFVFAIFRPIRQRLQEFVDQRFYRRKYDARLTLDSFAATSREAVELDQLVNELTTVVGATIQPAHVSVWLHSAPIAEDQE